MSSNISEPSKSLKYRLLWFIGLYIAGIVIVGGFIFLMRLLLGLPV